MTPCLRLPLTHTGNQSETRESACHFRKGQIWDKMATKQFHFQYKIYKIHPSNK